jgi:hypothetical protein
MSLVCSLCEVRGQKRRGKNEPYQLGVMIPVGIETSFSDDLDSGGDAKKFVVD